MSPVQSVTEQENAPPEEQAMALPEWSAGQISSPKRTAPRKESFGPLVHEVGSFFPLNPAKTISLAHGANRANWSGVMLVDYSKLVREFLELIRERKVPFVIVGGIALLQYIQGRNTEDIELLISGPRLLDLPELEVAERNDMFAFGRFHELRIDCLFIEHPFFERIFKEFSNSLEYALGKMQTATIEGLILLKLFALPELYRQFDLDRVAIYEADLTQLMARSKQSDSFFLNVLSQHISESDLNSLGELLTEIRRKLIRLHKPI